MFRASSIVVMVHLIQSLLGQLEMPEMNIGFDAPVDGPQILGGQLVIGREFPFIVSLKLENGIHQCGGSIISSEWILTAAHCFPGLPIKSAQVGSNNLNNGSLYRVTKSMIHKQYNGQFLHDIALIKVSPHIKFSKSVKPVRLPRKNQITPAGTKATVAGWGQTSRDRSSSSPFLRKLDVTVKDLQLCINSYPANEVASTHVCAGTNYDFMAACRGDSGGPLVSNGELIGIVSFGSSICGLATHPTVYTMVSKYISWIKDIMENQ